MNKQDNESLIQELEQRLEWYMMEASDEEFNADEVQALMKWLDSLKGDEAEKIEEELPAEEALKDFWNYYAEREEEERLLNKDTKTTKEDTVKEHKIRKYLRRHKMIAAAAAVLIVALLGGSWQVVANAEKHGGFFWWMDKSEEGTTMITSPDEDLDRNNITSSYYAIEDVPEKYRKYAEIPLGLSTLQEYELNVIKIMQRATAVDLYVFMQDEAEDIVEFEIRIYPQNVLRIRESYIGYDFEEELEKDGVTYEVFEKKELDGRQKYIVYFYFENVKYAIVGIEDRNFIKNVIMECGRIVTENNSI